MSMWRVVTRNVIFKSKLFLNNCTVVSKMPFYAVAKGRTPGIFNTWPECEAQVKGFPGARYKKFNTTDEAQNFVTTEGGNTSTTSIAKQTNKRNTLPVSSTSNDLKRSYSTSNTSQNYVSNYVSKQSKSKSKPKASGSNETFQSDQEDPFSDDSDDLGSIISKQMDDIEKRLKTFEKGVDKIIKGAKKTILIEPPEVKRQKMNDGGEFELDSDGFVQVYTDGACSSNGKNSAKAGLGVYWGEGHPLNVSEPVSGRATNNCGEIQAATKAIKQALQNDIKKLAINTDSKFVINSVTKWMPGWKRKGWKLASGEPVKNEIDFKDLDSVIKKLQIKWNYVEAHRGIHGNEMADQLAKAGAARYNK